MLTYLPCHEPRPNRLCPRKSRLQIKGTSTTRTTECSLTIDHFTTLKLPYELLLPTFMASVFLAPE